MRAERKFMNKAPKVDNDQKQRNGPKGPAADVISERNRDHSELFYSVRRCPIQRKTPGPPGRRPLSLQPIAIQQALKRTRQWLEISFKGNNFTRALEAEFLNNLAAIPGQVIDNLI